MWRSLMEGGACYIGSASIIRQSEATWSTAKCIRCDKYIKCSCMMRFEITWSCISILVPNQIPTSVICACSYSDKLDRVISKIGNISIYLIVTKYILFCTGYLDLDCIRVIVSESVTLLGIVDYAP